MRKSVTVTAFFDGKFTTLEMIELFGIKNLSLFFLLKLVPQCIFE